jgi:DNA-binding response OmpR family regulator
MKQLILVVDSDVACRDALRVCLQSGGLDVAVLYEPGKALARIEVERPALIVTTNGPGYGGGLAVLQALRSRGDDLPIIMLGDQDDVTERIVALECGADDFISKPFNVREVLARIRRVLKRTDPVVLQDPVARPPFSFNGFELDYTSRTLTYRGKTVPLLQTEYAMLNLFTNAPGRVLSKEVIAQRIWPEVPQRHATVGVWVHRLRARIERDAAVPELIRTVRAQGYVFRPVPDDSVREAPRPLRLAVQPAVGTMRAHVR